MSGESPVKSTNSNLSLDREKFLAARLLERAYMKLVAHSVCEKMRQPRGTGVTAYFVRYKRMNVPTTALTEGVDPADSSISVEEVTVTLDQWGDVLTITDVAILTTKHPLFNIAMELLADNAQRVIDREVQNVWLAGTNVYYGPTTVGGTTYATARSAVLGYIDDTILQKVKIFMLNSGAPPRDGPANMSENARGREARGTLLGGSAYVLICGPEITGDMLQFNSGAATNAWTAVAQYQNKETVYNGEIGKYFGFRIVETNFIPRFATLGNTTAAAALGANAGGITGLTTAGLEGGSGTLTNATTYFWKVTRKNLLRGFEEDISIAHSTATGTNEGISFAFPSTAGYVYNLYFDKTQGGGTGVDSGLGLVQANIAAGATVNVLAVATGTAPPPSITTAGQAGPTAVHPAYVHGKGSCYWVGLQDLQFMTTKDEATTDNPLKLRRMMSYKFLAKAMRPDEARIVRIEVASRFSVIS